MEELKRAAEDRIALSGKIDALTEKVTELRVDIARKGAIWGAVSGAVIAAIGMLLKR